MGSCKVLVVVHYKHGIIECNTLGGGQRKSPVTEGSHTSSDLLVAVLPYCKKIKRLLAEPCTFRLRIHA